MLTQKLHHPSVIKVVKEPLDVHINYVFLFPAMLLAGIYSLLCILAGSVTGNTASLTSPANINFGRIQSGSNYFLGSLDEVAVYNTALSGSTVTSHYNAGQ